MAPVIAWLMRLYADLRAAYQYWTWLRGELVQRRTEAAEYAANNPHMTEIRQ